MPAAVSKRKPRSTSAATGDEDAAMANATEDESRLPNMESDLHRQSGELTKLRVGFQSSSDVLRSDFEKKFTVFEAKQNHTDEACTKMLALPEGRNPSSTSSCSSTASVPDAGTKTIRATRISAAGTSVPAAASSTLPTTGMGQQRTWIQGFERKRYMYHDRLVLFWWQKRPSSERL